MAGASAAAVAAAGAGAAVRAGAAGSGGDSAGSGGDSAGAPPNDNPPGAIAAPTIVERRFFAAAVNAGVRPGAAGFSAGRLPA